MSTIKVIVARVGQAPVVKDMDDTLEGMQAIVGGYVEMIMISETVDMYFHEEGRLRGFPLNRYVMDVHGNNWDILGDLFLASHDDQGETISLSDADVEKWLPRLGG
jgi:hypothetical protein